MYARAVTYVPWLLPRSNPLLDTCVASGTGGSLLTGFPLLHCLAQVTLAGNGALAVAEFEKDRFDAVLLDINMPVLDGVRPALHASLMTEWRRKKRRCSRRMLTARRPLPLQGTGRPGR